MLICIYEDIKILKTFRVNITTSNIFNKNIKWKILAEKN